MNALDKRACGHFAIERMCDGCFEGLNNRIEELAQAYRQKVEELEIAIAVMAMHECPGDGSIDQTCYLEIMSGKKCSITEVLDKIKP